MLMCGCARMEFLHRSYVDARSPCDYTFNFWTDYLGLSTLVAKTRSSSNSITQSLKATLGLDDHSPGCSCVNGDAHLDCCSIYALRERISLLAPYEHLSAGRDAPSHGAGFRLLSAERRRKQSHRAKPEPRVCVFCRNNGAPEEVFGTHVLKAADGRVLCPILRAYTCPLCSASGDSAHTIKYCPLSREQPNQNPNPRMVKGGRGGKRIRVF